MSDTELISLLCLLALWAGCNSAQENGPGPGVVNVPEGDDARLDCAQASGQSVDEFDWRKDNGDKDKKEVFMYKSGLQGHYQDQQFKGRVEFFQHKLESGNASILIKNTRLEDNGTYTCGLGLEMYKRQEIHIRLNVGAAPEPHVKPFPIEDTRWLLQCKVQGVPKPEMEWKDSAGKAINDKNVVQHQDASGRFHVQLTVNVTKSDNYTCVVTQRDIYHQINNTQQVRIQGKKSDTEGFTTFHITMAALVPIVLLCVLMGIILCVKTKTCPCKGQTKPNYNLAPGPV